MNCNKVLTHSSREFWLKEIKNRAYTGKYHRRREREREREGGREVSSSLSE